MRDSFDRMYSDAAGFRSVSLQLRELLHCLYDRISERPSDVSQIRLAIEALFVYLASPVGRTDANCAVTDAFFSNAEEWSDDLDGLPENLRGLIEDISGTLHDTVHAPNIAMTFGSLPEQLLERIRAMELPDDE